MNWYIVIAIAIVGFVVLYFVTTTSAQSNKPLDIDFSSRKPIGGGTPVPGGGGAVYGDGSSAGGTLGIGEIWS